MHAHSRAGSASSLFDALVVFLEHLANLPGSIDSARCRHLHAFKEKGKSLLPVTRSVNIVEQVVVSLPVLIQK